MFKVLLKDYIQVSPSPILWRIFLMNIIYGNIRAYVDSAKGQVSAGFRLRQRSSSQRRQPRYKYTQRLVGDATGVHRMRGKLVMPYVVFKWISCGTNSL